MPENFPAGKFLEKPTHALVSVLLISSRPSASPLPPPPPQSMAHEIDETAVHAVQ
jgi:hypothetical protein